MMLVYLIFAPVTNEQLLAAVVPLGLLSRNFSHKVAVFPLAYIAFNSAYFYFATPILFASASLRSVYYGLTTWWGTAVGAYVIQARYASGAAMGVACLLLARSTFEGPLRLKLTFPQLTLGSRRPERA